MNRAARELRCEVVRASVQKRARSDGRTEGSENNAECKGAKRGE